MYQKFDDGVAGVISTLTSESQKRANRHYFALFREYLTQNVIPYSHQAALDWLSENEYIVPPWKYIRCRNAIFKLDDILTNGVLAYIGHYPYDNAPKYAKLSEWSKKLLNSVLGETTYVGSGKNIFRVAAAEFLYFLQGQGVNSAEEITIRHFTSYLRYMKETRNDIVSLKSYIRHVGVFLSAISNSDTFQILAQKCHRISAVIILDDLPDEHKDVFAEAIESGKTISMPASDFFESIHSEDDRLETLRYSASRRRQYSNFCKSFGLFLLLNELDFSPQLIKCWANYCGRELAIYPHLMGRHIFNLKVNGTNQSKYAEKNRIPQLTSGQKNMITLPIWSRVLLEQYIFDEQRRGQEQSSLETQRYACIRFLRFLKRNNITSCEDITPEVLKEFNLSDIHSTPEGKKGCNSRIGRFIGFLGEQGLVSETLRLALPCKVAKKVTVVKTLNESEISSLYVGKDNAESPLALRDAAIALIGLRMGLRAGDITNLKLCDISWKNRTISIFQNKTGNPLILPMPITVGNCIYRYLLKGRPISESSYIFISHKAPYPKLRSIACADATKRMIFGSTSGRQGYGSRILRKTFASGMLKSGNSADAIANMLGHDGNHTVMTYLSTDDEKMRMCAILAGKVVQL